MKTMSELATTLTEAKSPVPSKELIGPRVLAWCALMDLAEAFLLAGLRRKVGPDGNLNAAFRDWYNRQMAEHDREIREAQKNRQRATEENSL